MSTEIDKKHPDILFLEKRSVKLVSNEEYEKAAVIKKWVDELKNYYDEHKKYNKKRIIEGTGGL